MRILFALLLCASPALAQTPQLSELEQLLTALPLVPTETSAARIEQRISQLWAKSGGPTVALLLDRAEREVQADDAVEALRDYDAILALEPGMAEAFARRALAKYHRGDVSGALADLQAAISREPRHFEAWRSLAAIAEDQGQFASALSAWRELLKIDPQTPDGNTHLQELVRKVEGEAS